VVACSAAPELAKGISDILGMPLGKATIGRFNDGECNIQVSARLVHPLQCSESILAEIHVSLPKFT